MKLLKNKIKIDKKFKILIIKLKFDPFIIRKNY